MEKIKDESGQVQKVIPSESEARRADRTALMHMRAVRPLMVPTETGDTRTMRQVRQSVLESEEGVANLREHLLFPYRLENRLWSRVSCTEREPHSERIDTSCWEWTGSLIQRQGYGSFTVGVRYPGSQAGKSQSLATAASRMVWVLSYGPVRPKFLVCHLCNNRKCCRPSHLYLGTYQANSKQMAEDGRGGRKSGIPLGVVREIRAGCAPIQERGLLGPSVPRRDWWVFSDYKQEMCEKHGLKRPTLENFIHGKTHQEDLLLNGGPERRAYPNRNGQVFWPDWQTTAKGGGIKMEHLIDRRKQLLSIKDGDVAAAVDDLIEAEGEVAEAQMVEGVKLEQVQERVWKVLDGVRQGAFKDLTLADFLGFKSSKIKLLGGVAETGVLRAVTVTVPAHSAEGNFKAIKDEKLLAQVSDSEEHKGFLFNAVKGKGSPAEPKKVVLNGDLADWFQKHFLDEDTYEVGLDADRPDIQVIAGREAEAPSTILTVSPKQFVDLIGRGAGGDELARRMVKAGFKTWRVATDDGSK